MSRLFLVLACTPLVAKLPIAAALPRQATPRLSPCSSFKRKMVLIARNNLRLDDLRKPRAAAVSAKTLLMPFCTPVSFLLGSGDTAAFPKQHRRSPTIRTEKARIGNVFGHCGPVHRTTSQSWHAALEAPERRVRARPPPRRAAPPIKR